MHGRGVSKKAFFSIRIDADSLDVVSIQDLEEAMSRKKLSSFLESMGISTEELQAAFSGLKALKSMDFCCVSRLGRCLKGGFGALWRAVRTCGPCS